MKRSRPPFTSMLAIVCLILAIPSCGVTVGNSGPPALGSESDFAALVALQHDEVISAVIDQNSKEASPALAAFASAPEDSANLAAVACQENADNSASLSIHTETKLSYETGKEKEKRVISDNSSIQGIMLFRTASQQKIRCGLRDKPVISWAQLIELRTEETLSKERERSVRSKADGSLLKQLNLSIQNTRASSFDALEIIPASRLTLRKSTSFRSEITVASETEEWSHKKTISTVDAHPLVLERSLNKDESLNQAMIRSGQVQTERADGQLLVLVYADLILAKGASCHPKSGSIAGKLYQDASQEKLIASFSIVFSGEDVLLRYDNGQEEPLNLEACQI